MRLKSLYLRNIRSYVNQVVEFPEGSVMLSGDIGAGKTTILLAIEFALFGVRKPDLTGSSLLRKSATEGAVRLEFSIDETQVIIERRLKKAKDIKQDAGFIIVDGVKTEATPVELKARIIDILGYPKDLLSKHKDLIYRYTVYTPQEEMKAILFEDKEARRNTIRRVFGIDKYRKIRENSHIFLKRLRERKAGIMGAISALPDKQKQLEIRDKKISEVQTGLSQIKPKLDTLQKDITTTKEKVMEYEKKINIDHEAKKRIAILDEKLEYQLQRFRELKTEAKKTGAEIEGMSKIKKIEKQDISGLKAKRKKLSNEIESMKLTQNNSTMRIQDSEKIIDNISSLEECPTCEQDVTDRHKSLIKDRENARIKKFSSGLDVQTKKIVDAEKKLLLLDEKIDKAHLLENERQMAIEKQKQVELKKDRLKEIEETKFTIKKQIGSINEERKKAETIKTATDIEKQLIELKKKLEEQMEVEKGFLVRRAGLEEEYKANSDYVKELKSELKKMGADKKRLGDIVTLHDWLDEHFLNLMVTMEKYVMSQLYSGFNESFSEWFRILIEDETMSVRLDEEFSPLVEQNGYDTELHSLSGGERTSIALAYRLALNKVINEFVARLNTKDLIILDEPTDGFSAEQLDRVRDLLDAAHFGQMILVSHESKIESYVDKVLRISKNDHVSQISS